LRIIVTGAAGFIGSRLVSELVSNNHNVVAVDSLNNYYSPDLKKKRVKEFLNSKSVSFEKNNLYNLNDARHIFRKTKADTVIHLAAQPGVRLESSKYINDNLIAFSNVLVLSKESNVQNFLYASSSSVYGELSASPFNEIVSKTAPNSFYGGTKLANEILAKAALSGTDIKHRALRFFSVYGPWGRPDMAYFRIIASALSGKEFKLRGDGTIERDFTYIDDAVSMIYKLLLNLEKSSMVFGDSVNVGGGRPLSINYLIDCVSNQMKKPINVQRVAGALEDSPKTCADYEYLNELVGDRPRIELEAGINKTINWALEPRISKKIFSWVNSVK